MGSRGRDTFWLGSTSSMVMHKWEEYLSEGVPPWGARTLSPTQVAPGQGPMPESRVPKTSDFENQRDYVKDVAVGDQHTVLKGFMNKLTSSKLQHRGSTRSTWVIERSCRSLHAQSLSCCLPWSLGFTAWNMFSLRQDCLGLQKDKKP